MSLINQALKKEQIRRSGLPDLKGAPLPPAHQAMVAKRDKGDKNTKIVIGASLAGVSLLVLVTVLSIAGLKRVISSEEASIANIEETERTHVNAIANSETSPPIINEASLSQPSPGKPSPVLVKEAVLAEAELAQSASPPTATPKANPETQQFLESLNFQAVRLADENSRLLLDGRVYQIGNLLGEEGNRLLFKGVEGNLLVFEDTDGATYKISG